jgi:hypothetical protein
MLDNLLFGLGQRLKPTVTLGNGIFPLETIGRLNQNRVRPASILGNIIVALNNRRRAKIDFPFPDTAGKIYGFTNRAVRPKFGLHQTFVIVKGIAIIAFTASGMTPGNPQDVTLAPMDSFLGFDVDFSGSLGITGRLPTGLEFF